MKSSAIFLILLSIISFAYTQKAFEHVKNVLLKFRQSNIDEQNDADAREKKERAWCSANIEEANKVVASRVKEGEKIKKEINELTEQIKEWKIDIEQRRKRIASNISLLKKFKEERCDNNLLFVKNLRDHIEGIDILQLLRKDIVDYFAKKIIEKSAPAKPAPKEAPTAPKPTKVSFVQIDNVGALEVKLFQRIMKLGDYSHLLNDKDKLALSQLSKFGDDVKAHSKNVDEFTKISIRGDKEIGSGHVDNKRGELNRLETPKFQESLEFNIETRNKILKMIDGLIEHLKESKEHLIQNEVKAGIDFAHFQRSIIKENKHLKRTIKKLEVKVAEGQIKLNELKKSYEKALVLIKQAKTKLQALENLCNKKFVYFKRETKRRDDENKVINSAINVFANLLKRSEKYRAQSRASSDYYGTQYAKADKTHERVVEATPEINSGIASRQKERHEVAL